MCIKETHNLYTCPTQIKKVLRRNNIRDAILIVLQLRVRDFKIKRLQCCRYLICIVYVLKKLNSMIR